MTIKADQRYEAARLKEAEFTQFCTEFPMRLIRLMAKINACRDSYSYSPNAMINYELREVVSPIESTIIFRFYERDEESVSFNLSTLCENDLWQFDVMERVVKSFEEERAEQRRQAEFKKVTLEKAKSLLSQEELKALGL